jgi:hypothetical protein
MKQEVILMDEDEDMSYMKAILENLVQENKETKIRIEQLQTQINTNIARLEEMLHNHDVRLSKQEQYFKIMIAELSAIIPIAILAVELIFHIW